MCRLAKGAYTLIYSKEKAEAKRCVAAAKALADVTEGELVTGASRPVDAFAANREPALSFVWAVFGDVLNFIKARKRL